MEMGSSMDSLGKVSAITTSNKISTGKDNVLLINRHTTSSRIKEISSSLYPYGEPQYPMYPQPNTGSNGLAIASLVLGIVSLVLVAAFSWMLWGSIAGLCLGIVGTILGVMGRKNDTGRTMATAGMILSIIGIAIGAICFISCFTYYITYASYRYYWY